MLNSSQMCVFVFSADVIEENMETTEMYRNLEPDLL